MWPSSSRSPQSYSIFIRPGCIRYGVLSFNYIYNPSSLFVSSQVGMADTLYKKYRFTLLVIFGYFVLSTTLHVWLTFNYGLLKNIAWPLGLSVLFTFQRFCKFIIAFKFIMGPTQSSETPLYFQFAASTTTFLSELFYRLMIFLLICLWKIDFEK